MFGCGNQPSNPNSQRTYNKHTRRRICCAEAERARQLKYDELSTQQKGNPSAVNQLMVQIQELQDKVNSMDDAKEFHDSGTASSSGLHHVPNQPMSLPSPRGTISRDSCLPLDTRNSLVPQESFLVYLLEVNHLQHSAKIRRIWHRLLADQCHLIQAKQATLRNKEKCWERSLQPGTLHVIQKEQSRKCISINSLTPRACSAGKPNFQD